LSSMQILSPPAPRYSNVDLSGFAGPPIRNYLQNNFI
jgi:hypothetical protein